MTLSLDLKREVGKEMVLKRKRNDNNITFRLRIPHSTSEKTM